jgi:hypothetical protein
LGAPDSSITNVVRNALERHQSALAVATEIGPSGALASIETWDRIG